MKPKMLYTAYTNPLAPFSGFAYRTCGILQWLTERFDVDLVFEGTESELESAAVSPSRFRTIRIVPGSLNFTRKAAACLSLRPYHHTFWSTAAFRSALQTMTSDRKYDLIWTNTTVHMPLLMDVPVQTPIIVDQHASETGTWDSLIHADPRWYIRLYSRWNKFIDLRYERLAYSRVAGVICISSPDEAITNKLYPDTPSICIPQGVDPSYYCPSAHAVVDPDLIVFSGTDATRNVVAVKRFVTEIMPLVHLKAPGMKFLWVGKVDRSKYAFLDQPWIHTTGFVPHTPPHIDRGMIFVSPFQMGEGMKTKIVEAMAMGKVIVTTRIGASGFDTLELPFMKTRESNQEFADAIVEFRGNSKVRVLGMNAREYAIENFSWSRVLQPLGSFLSRCLGDQDTQTTNSNLLPNGNGEAREIVTTQSETLLGKR